MGPTITFPQNDAEYFINKKNPEPLQLTASVPDDVSKIYWYINERFYKATNRGRSNFLFPTKALIKFRVAMIREEVRQLLFRLKKLACKEFEYSAF